MAASGADKRKEIEDILSTLNGADEVPLNKSATLLQKLKVYGRDPKNADAIYSRSGIETLGRYGAHRKSTVDGSREALGCLANATLLKPSTRQTMVDLGLPNSIADLYNASDETDEEFLCARLLLMLTAETDLDYRTLIEKHKLALAINKSISKHAALKKALSSSGMPTPETALSETLKLLYALLTFYPDQSEHFDASAKPLLGILTAAEISDKTPMQPPINHVINALFKFEQSTFETVDLFPDEQPDKLAALLLDVMKKTIDSYPSQELDVLLSPPLGLVGEMYKIAPGEVRNTIKKGMLPSDEERTKPLGQAETLAAKLLRLSTSGFTPELRRSIPTVLFALSDKDAEAFVKNVGFGYAAGFLNNNQIPLAAPGSSSGGNSAADAGGRQVNPVTGQFLSEEAPSDMLPMTEEEKEREAERLFVLFERLKATGVMDVQNPIEEAVQSGRFEELD